MISYLLSPGSAGSHRLRLLAIGLGAEGEGGGDDHQHRGAGQEEVRAVLARGWLLPVRPGGRDGAAGECSGTAGTPPPSVIVIGPDLQI